ncbi:tenascin-R isoform X3 [Agrilus planipennis]|uniref:Tenascin-R isoform X3 n=1 Tax=Agrilus planipennis TaxID=224129 RepID=A0A1W4WM62_AGRPL|nr:tenascin-R isoform X3 [Agrilus planipennis]
MILLAAIAILQSAVTAGSMPAGPGIPENITVTFLTPTSVRVSWATTVDNVDKYDVTYKPTGASYRVVAVVAGNSDALTLTGLKADTQYHLTVSAIWAGKRYRSRPIVFRTLEQSRYSAQHDIMTTHGTGIPPTKDISDVEDLADYPQTNFTVRGVEIGIVLLVLVVWVAAIALFFNRWGKIRMLLPYQPDFKEQLKVPGTVACAAAVAAGNTCNHTTELVCSQDGCCMLDRCFRYPRRTTENRDCGCQFALLHRADCT